MHVTLTVPFDIRLRREQDRWSFDPRGLADEQTGEEVYRDNPLDRGHLVRRLDPTWRISLAAAKSAGDDTFHFTNHTPQHKDFNQNQTTWAGLEDYLLENADNRDLKASARTPPARGVVLGTRGRRHAGTRGKDVGPSIAGQLVEPVQEKPVRERFQSRWLMGAGDAM